LELSKSIGAAHIFMSALISKSHAYKTFSSWCCGGLTDHPFEDFPGAEHHAVHAADSTTRLRGLKPWSLAT